MNTFKKVQKSQKSSFSKPKKFSKIPVWNSNVKEPHRDVRYWFLKWVESGRERSGWIFEYMKIKRNTFHQSLKFCRAHEKEIRNDNIYESFKNKDFKKLWKDIRKIKGSSKLLPAIGLIDKHNNDPDIAKHFHEKYKKVLDNKECQKGNEIIDSSVSNMILNRDIFYITFDDMNNAIENLNFMSGPDDIHTNHFRFASNEFKYLFYRLLNLCMSHAYIPNEMIIAEISPRVKDKFGKMSSSDNYRPVMSSTIALKILEYCLLPTLERYISISPNQFGYRNGTSATMAVLTVKEVISKYINSGTDVHSAFLDMSKAYDCLNHHTLLKKLIDAQLPSGIIAIIKALYFNQNFVTVYNESKSSSDHIGNGIRQGGIMSGILFNFYINDLIDRINLDDSGCTLHHNKYAIVAYADDLVVMTPSKQSLQKLINLVNNLMEY